MAVKLPGKFFPAGYLIRSHLTIDTKSALLNVSICLKCSKIEVSCPH
jgi:hypothetical protein